MIRFSIDDPTIAVGEMLTGKISWTADGGSGGARAIALAVQWETGGEGNVAFGVGRATRVELRDDQRSAEVPVRLLIPYEGPITFKGELISIVWKLWVRVDRRGFDEVADTEFQVGPRVRRQKAEGRKQKAEGRRQK